MVVSVSIKMRTHIKMKGMFSVVCCCSLNAPASHQRGVVELGCKTSSSKVLGVSTKKMKILEVSKAKVATIQVTNALGLTFNFGFHQFAHLPPEHFRASRHRSYEEEA